MKKESFIKEYSKAVHEGYAAIFAGAGTSVAAGFVNWANLVEPFANDIDLKMRRGDDLVEVMQYYQNHKGGRGAINNQIFNKFSVENDMTETIEILTRLPISTYWTTNYDELLEQGLLKNNRKADVKKRNKSLSTNLIDSDAIVYKMHGDVSIPDEVVITKDDYEMYHETHPLFSIALQGDMVSKTFLFVGFSFADPNMNQVLSRLKSLLDNNSREHYCFLKKVNKREYSNSEGVNQLIEYENDLVRQNLKINDLKRYGIQTVLLDNYDEIPEILSEIEKMHLNRCVYISGSISDYSSEWPKEKVDQLCYNISNSLVKRNLKISSGFGLGIGSNVINGALDEIYKTKFRHLNEHLVLYPFPHFSNEGTPLAKRWTDYREKIISEAGICIFLFGNKIEGDSVVIAGGVLEEFEIAKKMGKIIIPLPTTGDASKQIFDIMKDDADTFNYLEEYWNCLENCKPGDLEKLILEIISENQ